MIKNTTVKRSEHQCSESQMANPSRLLHGYQPQNNITKYQPIIEKDVIRCDNVLSVLSRIVYLFFLRLWRVIMLCAAFSTACFIDCT